MDKIALNGHGKDKKIMRLLFALFETEVKHAYSSNLSPSIA